MVNGRSVVEALEGRRLFSFPIGVGGAGVERVVSVASDRAGTVFVTGTYEGAVDFDPGAGTAELSGGGGFVARYGADGSFAWARSFAGTTPAKVATDAGGNVYFAGSFDGAAVDFDPRRGVNLVLNQGGTDGFVCKLTPTGNLVFVRPINGKGNDAATALAVDRAGVIYVGGSFQRTLSFVSTDRDASLVGQLSADFHGSGDGFLASYGADGAFRWSGSFLGINSKTVADLALDDAGNVLATGQYSGTVDFDPRKGSALDAVAATPQAYVLKWDANGRFVWMSGLGGSGVAYGTAITADRAGNVYTLGQFSEVADFDPGAGTLNLTAPSSGRTFVSKLDAAGALVWARAIGGSADASVAPGEVAVDKSQNVYTTGRFSGTQDFDPGAGTSNLSSAGLDDVFVSKLDQSGTLVFALKVGGTTADKVLGSVLDRNGDLLVTGAFTGTANFATTGPARDLASDGDEDGFIVKLTAAGDPA